MGVLNLVVTLDLQVARDARENFTVAGIGKLMPVRQLHGMAGKPVADDRAMVAQQDIPEERQQLAASVFRRVRPELGIELGFGDGLAFVLRLPHGAIHALEDFLAAHAVERDQDQPIRGRRDCRDPQRQRDEPGKVKRSHERKFPEKPGKCNPRVQPVARIVLKKYGAVLAMRAGGRQAQLRAGSHQST